MTYCLGVITRYGIVMAADSLTNAGVDYISNYQKLFNFSDPGDRVIVLCTAGNLSMSQGILALLRKDLKAQAEANLHTLPSMFEVARYIGQKTRQVLDENRTWLQQDKIEFQSSFLLGGQIKGEEPCLFLIYSQGNCLQATKETPFLQIGEAKYGKPILDRTLNYDIPLEDAAKCALLSIDSTMKSNISVGPPINMVMYEADSLLIRHQLRLPVGDPYLVKVRKYWEGALRKAFDHMPPLDWHDPQPNNFVPSPAFPDPTEAPVGSDIS
ncbi:MAG: proteasome-type protease [Aphanocapsa sp. GSE-SYN-MK-11-07L]|jgi:putative proteasome-type protease|nr:proteasome-type protease [Aphanocapsa sp. GSE-SYN-MK-11-07L]